MEVELKGLPSIDDDDDDDEDEDDDDDNNNDDDDDDDDDNDQLVETEDDTEEVKFGEELDSEWELDVEEQGSARLKAKECINSLPKHPNPGSFPL